MMAFQLPGPGPMVVASVHHTGMRKGPWIRAGWLGFSATGLSKSKGDKKKLGQRSSGGEAGRGMGGRRDLPGMVMTGPGRILTEKMTRKMKTIGRIGIGPGISKTIGKTGRIGIAMIGMIKEMAPDLALDLQRQRLERRLRCLQHVF